MSVQDVLDLLARYPGWVQSYFVLPPALAALFTLAAPKPQSNVGVWDYCVSGIVYLVAIPGMVAAVLIGYSLFFIGQNLLEVNALIYFLPVVSMIATFVLIGRSVSFQRLPGFGRLTGLMILIGLSFAVVLAVYKTRLLVGFFGSFETLLALGVVLFVVFRVAASKLMK